MLSYHEITDNIIGLQGLDLAEIMPDLYYLMLITGQRYNTGSDYTEEELKMTTDEYEKTI